MNTFQITSETAAVLLTGRVLSANGVTAGNGRVIDWRTVKNGETVLENGDAFDVATSFITTAGWFAVGQALDGVVGA